jgi:hypothetical protein
MVSSIVSTIMFTTQFNFFFLMTGFDFCVEPVSVDELNSELSTSVSTRSSLDTAFLILVLSIISSGIDSVILRFCQNIAIREHWVGRNGVRIDYGSIKADIYMLLISTYYHFVELYFLMLVILLSLSLFRKNI